MVSRARAIRSSALALLVACGGGSSEEAVGSTVVEEPTEAPTELTLKLLDDEYFELGEQRGHVVLLYFFATFDGVSQAALQPLAQFAEAHPDVLIVGVAIQPSARELLDAYVHALSPPFLPAYDPEESIVQGASDLGRLDTVPSYVFIDALGIETGRHEGAATRRVLEDLFSRIRRRRGPRDETQPPLLGAPRP